MTVRAESHRDSHRESNRPVPTRPVTTSARDAGHSNLTPLPSKGTTQDVARLDYAAYLDSMLAHLRRVHRGQVLRYYGLEDADG
jgi:hypothetical protein